jgi:hypothetical protein
MVIASSTSYDEVIVTRPDVYDLLRVSPSWYQRGGWNVIGHGELPDYMDDRIIIGDAASMLPLHGLYDQFLLHSFSADDIIPEGELKKFFVNLPQAPLIVIRAKYVNFASFTPEKSKYEANFGETLEINNAQSSLKRSFDELSSPKKQHGEENRALWPPVPCQFLSHDFVTGTVAISGGAKAKFFQGLRLATNLTRHTMGPTGISVEFGRVLFVGDGVVFEIASSFEKMTVGAHNEKGKSQFEFIRIEHWEPNTLADIGTALASLEEQGGAFKAIFLGGLALHYLERGGPMHAKTGDDPVVLHRSMIRSYLLKFGAFANKLNIPVVFVGSLPVDSTTIAMVPAKHGEAKYLSSLVFHKLDHFMIITTFVTYCMHDASPLFLFQISFIYTILLCRLYGTPSRLKNSGKLRV